MKTVEIWLTRHGESVANAEGRWQGQGDSPLSDQGQEQVAALRRSLTEERFDRIVSSDLQRAHQTSKAIDGTAETDPTWREMDVGDWEGLTMDEVVARFPEQVAGLREREAVVVGGGESWPLMFKRVDRALKDLRTSLDEGQRAIVFTHGGVIAAALAGLLGARDRWPWPMGRVKNTATTVLRFEGRRVSLVIHNRLTHLSPRGASEAQVLRPDQSIVALATESWEAVPEAARPAAEPLKEPGGLSIASLRMFANAAPGDRHAIVAEADHIASVAEEIARPAGRGFGFAAPRKGSLAHVLVSPNSAVLIDYQV